MLSLVYISIGAALGACSRWGLSLLLNPIFTGFTFGTLIANYLGCFLIGIASGALISYPMIGNEWRLFFITGFLGSLTTFSSFSGEVINIFLDQQWLTGVGVICLHLFGCLAFTLLGIGLWRLLMLAF
ncbi:fluoride efflux transporter CrcB [Gallibacterium sp. AGMB14963]|uniref:fluoride efflux transporter CrcB n=1 Tax=Gallibacterium faecale TaxID=3019086 RepID=UPI0022F1AB10|nr:fluoride efflux transporter CrcB [Gallibacterium sp. AGMB14963]MDA3979722.1 fluoride efflux transporter CrcB [Gallibacterium sp. AGMB14963]